MALFIFSQKKQLLLWKHGSIGKESEVDLIKIMKIVGLAMTIIGSVVTSIASSKQMDETIASKVAETIVNASKAAEELPV